MDKEKIRAELDAFIESGQARVEVNSGNFVTTHFDIEKIAEHFAECGYEQAIKDVIEQLNIKHNAYQGYYKLNRTPYYQGGCDSLDELERDIKKLIEVI